MHRFHDNNNKTNFIVRFVRKQLLLSPMCHDNSSGCDYRVRSMMMFVTKHDPRRDPGLGTHVTLTHNTLR